MLFRQLVSILALPGVVAVALPVWIARRNHITFIRPHDLASMAVVLCGLAVLAVGVVLFAASLFYFWSRGHARSHRGTRPATSSPRARIDSFEIR
jgi:hypothetical protein